MDNMDQVMSENPFGKSREKIVAYEVMPDVESGDFPEKSLCLEPEVRDLETYTAKLETERNEAVALIDDILDYAKLGIVQESDVCDSIHDMCENFLTKIGE
jgi:hypothetical protein